MQEWGPGLVTDPVSENKMEKSLRKTLGIKFWPLSVCIHITDRRSHLRTRKCQAVHWKHLTHQTVLSGIKSGALRFKVHLQSRHLPAGLYWRKQDQTSLSFQSTYSKHQWALDKYHYHSVWINEGWREHCKPWTETVTSKSFSFKV